MEKKFVYAPKLHTECFYSGTRSYFLDLMPTRLGELCVRMCIGVEGQAGTSYARIILFEKDLQHFITAFAGVMQAYMQMKTRGRLQG